MQLKMKEMVKVGGQIGCEERGQMKEGQKKVQEKVKLERKEMEKIQNECDQ